MHRWSSYEITEKVMQSIMNDAVEFAAQDLPEYCLRLILRDKSKQLLQRNTTRKLEKLLDVNIEKTKKEMLTVVADKYKKK